MVIEIEVKEEIRIEKKDIRSYPQLNSSDLDDLPGGSKAIACRQERAHPENFPRARGEPVEPCEPIKLFLIFFALITHKVY